MAGSRRQEHTLLTFAIIIIIKTTTTGGQGIKETHTERGDREFPGTNTCLISLPQFAFGLFKKTAIQGGEGGVKNKLKPPPAFCVGGGVVGLTEE